MIAHFCRWVQVWLCVVLITSAVPLQHDKDVIQVTGSAGIVRRDVQDADHPSKSLPTGNGTLAVLVKTENHTLWQLQFVLVPSLLRNVRFETPVTVMFQERKRGDAQLVKDAVRQLQGHSLLRPLHFVNVTEFFQPSQDELSILAGPGARMRDFGMGYRKMCEFWATRVYTLPALAQYRYLWRLDTDSKLTEPVTNDLYHVMNSHDSVFGYLLLQNAFAEACQGLQQATEAFYDSNAQQAPISQEALTFLRSFEARRCPHWNTNFQLMDLDFFRGSRAYSDYTRHLTDDLHGFVKYRWGDHIVQTLSVLTQVPPRRTLCMVPWVPGYEHQGAKPNCDPSISQPILVEEAAWSDKHIAAQLPTHPLFQLWESWLR